jgi:hypothetical protein
LPQAVVGHEGGGLRKPTAYAAVILVSAIVRKRFDMTVQANAGTRHQRPCRRQRSALLHAPDNVLVAPPGLARDDSCDCSPAFSSMQHRRTGSRSRGTRCPSFASFIHPPRMEGAGKAGRRPAPMVRVQQKARGRTTGSAENTRPSLREWVTACFALSSVHRAFWPPSSARSQASMRI